MTKEKMENLYEIAKEIVDMMYILGLRQYRNYSLTINSQGNFLKLSNTYISSSLSDIYVYNNLNKYMPATSIEAIKQFEEDIENGIFIELHDMYLAFNQSSENK